MLAETWPTKPIRIIVSLAAGGTPDIICRIVSERLATALGQQIVVENHPGGANVIGAQIAARAAPDGYTLFFATAATIVTNPFTFKTLPYDPLNDFVPIAMIAQGPFVVLAHPSVPAKSLSELFAYDKANPGKLAFATDGPRNLSGMLAAWLNKLGGSNILQVPYATMPQGVQDTIAGRLQLTVLAVPSAAPQIASGALKGLAVSSRTRLANLPQVPTIAETFPGIEYAGWFMMAAPAGTARRDRRARQRRARQNPRRPGDREPARRARLLHLPERTTARGAHVRRRAIRHVAQAHARHWPQAGVMSRS